MLTNSTTNCGASSIKNSGTKWNNISNETSMKNSIWNNTNIKSTVLGNKDYSTDINSLGQGYSSHTSYIGNQQITDWSNLKNCDSSRRDVGTYHKNRLQTSCDLKNTHAPATVRCSDENGNTWQEQTTVYRNKNGDVIGKLTTKLDNNGNKLSETIIDGKATYIDKDGDGTIDERIAPNDPDDLAGDCFYMMEDNAVTSGVFNL